MKAHSIERRTSPLSALERRELALRALVDERTFERALAGEPIRSLSRERIRRALAERGLEYLLDVGAAK